MIRFLSIIVDIDKDDQHWSSSGNQYICEARIYHAIEIDLVLGSNQ